MREVTIKCWLAQWRALAHIAVMMRLIMISVAMASAIQATMAAPLQPTGKWTMDYTPTSCEAKRRFGDVAIAIIPGPLGESTRVMIEVPGKTGRAKQYPVIIDPGDAGGAVKTTAVLFPMKANTSRGVYTVLPNALVERLLVSGMLNIKVGNPRLHIAANSVKASMALGKADSLRKALDTCMADLRTQWGMVGGKLPKPAIASFAQGDVRGIFTSEDYPQDAIDANQTGSTSFLLMIGKDGSVMDCVISQSSGIASLDAMGCQVIRERAKFKPAIDAAGKPTVDTYGTPFIKWMIAG